MSETKAKEDGKQDVPHSHHEEEKPRTTYSQPVLRVFGSLSTLTMGVSGTKVDGVSGKSRV